MPTKTPAPAEIRDRFKSTLAEHTSALAAAAAEAEARRLAEVEAAYRRLVDECSRGVEHAPEKILKQLAAWKIDLLVFQNAVELRCNRAEWLETSKTLPKYRRDLKVVADQKAAAKAEREAAVKAAEDKFAATVKELDAAYDVARDGERLAEEALRQLQATAETPDLMAERLADARAALAKARDVLAFEQGRIKPRFSTEEIHKYASAVDRLRTLASRPEYAASGEQMRDKKLVEALDARAHPDTSSLPPLERAVSEAQRVVSEIEGAIYAAATSAV
jgi:hypothetical protein